MSGDWGIDWRVSLKSLLWLLAGLWLLGTIFWPLAFYVFFTWARWVYRGARAEAAVKQEGRP